MAATPVKVYCAKPANSSCRFCKVDFSTKKLPHSKFTGDQVGQTHFWNKLKAFSDTRFPKEKTTLTCLVEIAIQRSKDFLSVSEKLLSSGSHSKKMKEISCPLKSG